jgi:hypothetical protein
MGIALLLSAFKQTNSALPAVSVRDRRVLALALDSEHLTLSLDEWIEVTIFGLKIIVVQGLLSFHHFENLGHRLRQYLKQQ